MSAKNVELADAIVDLLNEEVFPIPFHAHRKVVPFDDVQDIREVQVVVFTGPVAAVRITRGEFQRTYKPTVAVLQKIEPGDESTQLLQCDGLQNLVALIEERLTDEDLVDLTFQGFDEEQDRDPYNVEMLKALGAFATAITLTYAS
jgi:hypothetical protein